MSSVRGRSVVARLAFAHAAVVPLAVGAVVPAQSVWAGSALAQPPAAEILANVRKAVGFDGLGGYPHGVVLAGKADVGGMPCTYTHVLDAQGRDFRRMAGAITIESGFDGEREWVRDLGGEPRVLGLGEEIGARISGAILNGAWLGEASPMAFADASTGAGASVVGFTIDGAKTRGSVTIDNGTWRPTRWSFSDGSSEQTIELSGEVSLGELRFPARIEQTSARGARTVVEIESIRAATAADGALLTPDLSPPTDTLFDTRTPARLDVRRAPTGHLLVHPTVNGKDVGWFIFDTGAGANVLSTSARDALGLKPFGDIPAVGVGGTTRTSFVRPDELTLGRARFLNPLMIVLDLAFLTPHMGVEVGGIIGYSVLARTISEIDLESGTISIYDPAMYLNEQTHWAAVMVKDRVPCVKASFEGHTGWFRIDTGANSSVTMHEPAVRELGLLEGRETTDTKLGGVGGFVAARAGNLAWFDIGGTRIENVHAEFATEAKGAFAEAHTLGNIGTKVLRSFVIVLDYPHGRIAFVPRGPAKTD